MNGYSFAQWVMFFYVYSFIGWIYESLYVSAHEHRWVNRGFMKGPFLPIYGSGAILVMVVTLPMRGNYIAMAFAGMVSAAVLEYATGAAMEKMFRVRYWDYTGRFLNLNGHICFASVACWTFMTILLVDVVHPRLENLVFWLGESVVTGLVIVITPILTADFVQSFQAAIHLRDLLIERERIKEELERLNARREVLEAALVFKREQVKEQMAEARDQMKEQMAEAREKILELSGKTAEQLRAELLELHEKKGALRARVQMYERSDIYHLLKRNPGAVSPLHKETFADFKEDLYKFIKKHE